MKGIAQLLDFALRPNINGPVGPLELLVLQPTPFCNLNCDYCYLTTRSSTKKMSLDVLKAAFNRAFESGLIDNNLNVVWHAGEPLVVGIKFYEEALEAISQIKPKNVKIIHSFQTNATLIDDNWCEFIKRNDFKIGVSIDGPAFLHDQHRKTRRGEGTHLKVMEGVRLLQKHGIPFHVIAVLTKTALKYPNEVFNFFSENNIGRVGFNVEEKEGGHGTSTLDAKETHLELSEFISQIYDLNKTSSQPIAIREFERFEQAVLGWTPMNSKMLRYSGTQENSPFKIVNVDTEGFFSTFSPEILGLEMGSHGKFVFGNVLTDSFDFVSRTEKFQKISAEIQRGVEKCAKKCAYFSMCGGGAPANKYFENGSFDSEQTMHCKLHVKTLADAVMSKMESRSSLAGHI